LVKTKREDNFSDWYQEVIQEAELADHSPVRGCMIVRPCGMGIWERMKQDLDARFRHLGHRNAYFPLFIPLSFFEKEAEHVEGFATECAVVTHHRIAADENGAFVPAGPLEEPLVVRPTSETMVGEAFSRWISSYRDLPLLINQWSNVVRWEMRTRMFLRTTEILWQEGHTAHATAEEADQHARTMLDTYTSFLKERVAIPVVAGEKTEHERFPGAVATYTMEALMQDGKALQVGTSHMLGTHFSKASKITFQTKEGKEEYVHTTSWGVTTRMVGAMIMMHGDDEGCIVPPGIAPDQVVILPLVHRAEDRDLIEQACHALAQDIAELQYQGEAVRVHVDRVAERRARGDQFWGWVKKGIPIRIEVGKRELDAGLLSVGRRDLPTSQREQMSKEELLHSLPLQLQEMHNVLYERALKRHQPQYLSSKEDLLSHFRQEGASWVLAYVRCTPEIERSLQEELGVTVRCIPWNVIPRNANFDHGQIEECACACASACIWTGEKGGALVLVGKGY